MSGATDPVVQVLAMFGKRREHAARPAKPVDKTTAPGKTLGAARLRRFACAGVTACIIVATIRIVTTYQVFIHTADEPVHIACGIEWLDKKVYQYEHQRPPLARVAAAIGPYLGGVRSAGKPSMYDEGVAILNVPGECEVRLTLARLGILPFFWIASIVVFLWAKRYFGYATAFLAVLLFTFLPPVLAHSGLATTDMALAAMFAAAYLAMLIWLRSPTRFHSFLFGVALGLAVLSRFSSLVFLPGSALVSLAFYVAVSRPRLAGLMNAAKRTIPSVVLVLVIAFLVVWAAYRFSIGPAPFVEFSVPAPELFSGIKQVWDHNQLGHSAYLLGMHNQFGWWYYFPVVLAVKTPLPFLVLTVLGVVICVKRRSEGNGAYWLPVAFAAGVLLAAMPSRINIGVRHVLPVYIAFSIIAAVGASWLWEAHENSKRRRYLLGALLAWLCATSALSHPDYLAYFNAIAMRQPERIIVDSDLDWGQDLKRLAQRLHEVGAREVTISGPISPDMIAHLEAVHGFPTIKLSDPFTPSPGWNAVGLTSWKAMRFGLPRKHPEATLWPDRFKPDERVGKSILLYYFPPGRIASPEEVETN